MKSLLSLCLVAATLAAPAAARAGDDAPPAAAAGVVTPVVTPPGELPVAAPAATALSFDGIWMFDAAHSDDPRKVMEKFGLRRSGGGPPGGGEDGGPPGGGMGRGHRGGGMGHEGMGRGGMGGGPGGEEVGEGGDPREEQSTNSRGGGDPRRAMQRVLHPAQKLVVYVDKDRFQLEEDEGQPRVYTIADSLKALGVKPLNDEAVVRFRGRQAEARQPLGLRGALVETYELSTDGRTLTIRAKREGGPEGMPNPVLTRAYTRYEGE